MSEMWASQIHRQRDNEGDSRGARQSRRCQSNTRSPHRGDAASHGGPPRRPSVPRRRRGAGVARKPLLVARRDVHDVVAQLWHVHCGGAAHALQPLATAVQAASCRDRDATTRTLRAGAAPAVTSTVTVATALATTRLAARGTAACDAERVRDNVSRRISERDRECKRKCERE
jgi:hypothetical protein